MSDDYGSIERHLPARDSRAVPAAPAPSQPLSHGLAHVVDRFNGFAKANPTAAIMLVGGLVMVTVIVLKPKAKRNTLNARAERQLKRLVAQGRRSSSNLAGSLSESLDSLMSAAMAISPRQMAVLKERGQTWLHDSGYLKRIM